MEDPRTTTADDYAATVREALALFCARDPRRLRFGARVHGYRLRPPLCADRLEAIEAAAGVRLPDDYRDHLRDVGDGGAGPYYGLLPLDHPAQLELLAGPFPFDAPAPGAAAGRDPDPWRGVVALGHLGCGYAALLVVAGPAAGQVWIDARAAGAGVQPAYPSFRSYYVDWISRLAHAEWLPAHVPPGRCALPAALSAYFRAVEDRRGLAEGTLAGDALGEALEAIGPGGIAITHDGTTPLFADGDPVDVCVECARLANNLGLPRAAVAPGVPPIPARDDSPNNL